MPIGRIGCPALLALLFFATSPLAARGQVVIPNGNVQIAPRDRVPPPRTGTGLVKGRVVDGVTGAAVARARVTLMGATRATVLTDASGAFVFSNLPPGSLNISVDKSTYLNSRYPTPGRTIRSSMRPLMLADGQALDGLTVPIFHGGAISGRVFDASGDPVDYAQVGLLRMPSAGRVGRPTMRGGTSTDDRGEFRIGRLEPGNYLLQVTARRPNVDEPTPTAAPAPQPMPTYYPGVLSIDQAQPIAIERGQSATDLDIVLAEGVPGVVVGTVTMSNGSPLPEMNGYVNARRAVADGARMFDSYMSGTGVRPDGTFRLVLPPGDYQLEARLSPRVMNAPPKPEDEQFGTAKVSVNSGSEDAVAMTVGRGATATGRVVFEGTSPPPPSPGKARSPLFSETGECHSGEATIAPDWTFKLEGLSGTCSSPPFGMFGRWMLKAIIINGETTADTPLTFQPEQQFRNVQVIVTDKRSEMLFHVSDESGQPTREYVVLAYPVQKARWTTGARYSFLHQSRR